MTGLLNDLRYEPETGHFYWTKPGRKRRLDRPAGGSGANGYRQIRVGGRLHYGHRLAWLSVYGRMPAREIDHINGDRSDNRIANLREATRAQNAANAPRHRDNSSGLKGVIFDKRDGTWSARIRANGHTRHLGTYPTAEEAHGAYVKASVEFHQDFSRHRELPQ